MSIAISLLSGKGGTGKTTLTLSMADLLSKCRINTLIIDCDFSTNGATFFYESYLQQRMNKMEIYSLSDYIIENTSVSELKPLNIHEFLDFIPSIPAISNEIVSPLTVFHNSSIEYKIHELLLWSKSNYDVILFDCQAGYTEILDMLLPLMDADLFVLEADSISASSMRNLYLKIGKYIGNAKVYQIFNKASSEEFEIYSKIEGTFFVNIGTLLFDWKIRQAFSRASVPDLENVSSRYGADLCEICRVLITDREKNESLQKFSTHLQYLKAYEEKKQLENKLENFAISNMANRTRVIYGSYVIIVLVIMAFFLIYLSGNILTGLLTSTFRLKTILMMVTVIAMGLSLIMFRLSLDNNRDIRRRYEKELQEVDERLEQLRSNDEFIKS